MGASSEHPDLEAISSGRNHAGAVADGSGEPDHDVLSQDHLRLWETHGKAIIKHGLCSYAGFLRRLKDRHQRTTPRGAVLGKQRCRSYQPGHMHVMAAGMHHRHGLAIAIST